MTLIPELGCDELDLTMVKEIGDVGIVFIPRSALCCFARLHFGGNGKRTEPICQRTNWNTHDAGPMLQLWVIHPFLHAFPIAKLAACYSSS